MPQYKQFRMPMETYVKLKEKKRKIENDIFDITRKPAKVPMTKLVNLMVNRPLYLNTNDSDIIEYFTKRRTR